MANSKERLDKHDREIAAIRKLLHTGMKMLVKMQEEHATFRKEMRELRDAQMGTERTLERFIRSLERGNGNGHSTRKVR